MKRLLLTLLATAGVLGSFGLIAPSASASIERCSVAKQLEFPFSVQTCIFVDSANGRAQYKVSISADVDAHITLQARIIRSGSSATHRCDIVWQPGDPLPVICNAFAGNPAGEQAWRADTLDPAGNVVQSSPTVFDT